MLIEPITFMIITLYVYVLLISLMYMYLSNRRQIKRSTKLDKELRYFDKKARKNELDKVIINKLRFAHISSQTRKIQLMMVIGKYRVRLPETYKFLVEQLTSQSPTLRFYALNVASRLGDISFFIDALEHFTEETLPEKGLLTIFEHFSGNQEALHQRLEEKMWGWSIELQCVIIAYFGTQQYTKIKDVIRGLLIDESKEQELRIAAIKYFEYVDATQAMAELVEVLRQEEETLRALVLKLLKDYNERSIIPLLMQNIRHDNWYIRYHSARCLVAYEHTEKEQQMVLQGDDPYAKEILRYLIQKKEVEEETING